MEYLLEKERASIIEQIFGRDTIREEGWLNTILEALGHHSFALDNIRRKVGAHTPRRKTMDEVTTYGGNSPTVDTPKDSHNVRMDGVKYTNKKLRDSKHVQRKASLEPESPQALHLT
ncbi:hypothetical protein BDZ91DRAFT_761308 [Kalaharituber pfeilii]|nr:hypothetical protein BDZ91DRAFT_761308 [Kalaharituber pfeilii]